MHIIDEIGNDAGMSEERDAEARHDIVARCCSMGIVGEREQGLIGSVRGFEGSVLTGVFGDEKHHARQRR